MIFATTFLLMMIVSGSYTDDSCHDGHCDDFCYEENHCDPYAWGEIYSSCHPLLDEHHSPINLDHHMTRNNTLEALQLEGFDTVQLGRWKLKNNGHSIVLEVGSGMSVSGGGLPGVYNTVQLHFHWGSTSSNGSEHTMNGRRYPMEMHIVNMKSIHPNLTAAFDDPTGLAVLGIFIDVVYADHVPFSQISRLLSLVAYKGHTASVKPFPLIGLLPENNMGQYYRYHGSLTTPPCSPVVVWSVYEVPISLSYSQVRQFASGIFSTEEDVDLVKNLRNNFRHIHPTFSRDVYASKDAKRLTATAPPHLHQPVLSILLLQLALFICTIC
ncbi:carbonic anhydrase 15 [Hypomesus transpacificus]|uniref:carbonic anhydrase 15 n=1 Tax=Hypomesus transpacificus TaxID=137520 RepID=UPI001F084B2D|nr:carbonic anhydrase 15 [Hypomesus transpacificus]